MYWRLEKIMSYYEQTDSENQHINLNRKQRSPLKRPKWVFAQRKDFSFYSDIIRTATRWFFILAVLSSQRMGTKFSKNFDKKEFAVKYSNYRRRPVSTFWANILILDYLIVLASHFGPQPSKPIQTYQLSSNCLKNTSSYHIFIIG